MLKEIDALVKWWKVTCSFSYCLLFVIAGLVVASLGPAIGTLEWQLGETESQIGWLFVARGGGKLVAGLLGGKLVDVLQHCSFLSSHFVLCLLCFSLCALTLSIQYANSLVAMLSIFALSGACLGVGDVMGNTLLVWLWQKNVGPWMQLLHFGFGFGAVLVGSLFGILQTYFGEENEAVYFGYTILAISFIPVGILIAFCKTPQEKQITIANLLETPTGPCQSEVSSKTHEQPKKRNCEDASLSKVRIPCYGTTNNHKKINIDGLEKIELGTVGSDVESTTSEDTVHSQDLSAHNEAPLLFVMLCGLFLFLYVGAEVGYGGWIYSYGTQLNWATTTAGDFLTSSFWAALTAGRLVSVPLSKFLSTKSMLIADMAGCLFFMMVLAITQTIVLVFSVSDLLGVYSMWICSVGLGFSMASVYPCVISLPLELSLHVTGRNTGFLVVWASFGEFCIPFLFSLLPPTALPWGIIVIFLFAIGCYLMILRTAKARIAAQQSPPLPSRI